MPILGLVLTGGGARAAYQVGALRALSEIVPAGPSPFKIVVGISAGAINSTAIASDADDFRRGTERLWSIWANLSPEQVYRTDTTSLLAIGTRWLRELTSGGVLPGKKLNYLLDTAPLRTLLKDNLPTERLADHFKRGYLHGVAVTATSYATGTAVTFFDGDPLIPTWKRSMRIGIRQALTSDHVIASSAIPVFFPPQAIDGTYYGDGCIRLAEPLSPALHLGADRILAIGIRYFRSADQTEELNQTAQTDNPAISEITGTLLNSIFLDSLESDLERLRRVNRTLTLLTPEQRTKMDVPLRSVPAVALRPSQDLGNLAADQRAEFPATLRFLLRGIGVSGEKRSSDLLSYLSFGKSYLHNLLQLGYTDTLARRDELQLFFSEQDLPTNAGAFNIS